MSEAATHYVMPERREVVCECGKVVFNKVVVKARVVRIAPDDSVEAKCRCKKWIKLPLVYKET